MYERSTEIRRLAASDVRKLGEILDLSNDWKLLMSMIPKDATTTNLENEYQPKYNNEHIRLIENVSLNERRSQTEILLDEWGTSGKKRPTLEVLMNVLVKAQLLRAADLVALNFLNEPPPQRPPKGPGAPIPIDMPMDTEEIREIEADLNRGSYPGTDSLNDNANESLTMNNNRDFYEKYRNVSKNIQLKNSDTDLIQFSKSEPLSSSVENDNIPILSALATNDQIEAEPDDESDPNVPDLSALQNNSVAVPDLSALLRNDDASDSSSSSSVNSDNCESSVSSNISPNLNDSSLTTITETSGDNSFDISNGSFKSNDNIPV
ncbi:tub family protein [Megaselia abdita]